MFKGRAAFYVLPCTPSHGTASLACAPRPPGSSTYKYKRRLLLTRAVCDGKGGRERRGDGHYVSLSFLCRVNGFGGALCSQGMQSWVQVSSKVRSFKEGLPGFWPLALEESC